MPESMEGIDLGTKDQEGEEGGQFTGRQAREQTDGGEKFNFQMQPRG